MNIYTIRRKFYELGHIWYLCKCAFKDIKSFINTKICRIIGHKWRNPYLLCDGSGVNKLCSRKLECTRCKSADKIEIFQDNVIISKEIRIYE